MKSRIGDIRKSKGLMQIFVAEQLGIKQQQLSDWENSKRYPRIDLAFKLAKVLGVSVYDLWEHEEDE